MEEFMADQIPASSPPDGAKTQATQGLKNYFFGLIEEQGKILLKAITTAKNIGIVIVAWAVLSVSVSIYVAATDKCTKPKLQAGKILYSRLFCQ